MLSSDERIRYSRQVILPEFGAEGQELLKSSAILVIGAGGLGCPVLTYLTAAGVGTIGIIDDDVVSLSNLHRQVLFSADDVGSLKAEVAAMKLKKQNPHTHFIAYPTRLTSTNALDIFSHFDVIVDGSDNFATRYLANDAAIFANKPLVYGAIHQFEGQVSVFNQTQADGSKGPNYRDLFPTPPPPDQVPNCAEAGVLGILPGIIGSLQANEALKIILKMSGVLSGELLLFDARSIDTMKIKIKKSPENPVTGNNPTITSLINYDEFCGSMQKDVELISKRTIANLITKGEVVHYIDVRESDELIEHPHEGIHIPLSTLIANQNKIPTSGTIVFICRSGRRSALAIQELTAIEKSENWFSLAGGI